MFPPLPPLVVVIDIKISRVWACLLKGFTLSSIMRPQAQLESLSTSCNSPYSVSLLTPFCSSYKVLQSFQLAAHISQRSEIIKMKEISLKTNEKYEIISSHFTKGIKTLSLQTLTG